MSEPCAAPSQPVTLRLSPACDLGEVRRAVLATHEFLKTQSWGQDDLMSFDLALVEACNNAVKYADDTGLQKNILLETICEEGQVEFRIHDHTPGFTWPEKIKLPPSESESGRGLYLIHELMDSVGYFRGPGENIMILRKARPAGANKSDASSGTKQGGSAEDTKVITDLVE